MVGQSRFGRDRLEPRYMFEKLFTRLFDIIKACLNPLEPVSLNEPVRHIFNSFTLHVGLECIHTLLLIWLHIIPAIINTTIVLCSLICCHSIFSLIICVVCLGRRDIDRILPVVAWVIDIIRIRRNNWLFEFLKVLLIRPLLVKVGFSCWSTTTRTLLITYQSWIYRRNHNDIISYQYNS